jgi:hypothetical protein
MVLDLKLFTPGHDLEPNTLRIAEQFPSVVASRDVTKFILSYGHWPSYNVPSNTTLLVESGYQSATL